ncbi:glycoside hydrolase family 65 protein [Saccharibacillus sp. CPCC 101409]|uniref:glycoside hydrolase family 65 protein n=1 Tax=Saccharibacillus sp. CPCC 101409 TaxID=3058041 RepID=UPI002672D322|nr:glycoside hydrolase family 65 protein [Saccharibacillus sp. CPCC 101409]MDO3411333.1 glycoside hydrolase family 65 protein [Saccharibacillus sp. CPCC 101409]
MKPYLKVNEWRIVEEGFDPALNEVSESVFSIGNGYMGQRANFEEQYGGPSLQGSYMAGVYYPDKTRVGWWKNGYPEYFAKVLNSVNWIGIDVEVDGVQLDLSQCEVQNFTRTLDMREGTLSRSFTAVLPGGRRLRVESLRFVSVPFKEIGAIRYAVTPLDGPAQLKLTPYLDADVVNKDSNYEEKFWEEIAQEAGVDYARVEVKTRKLDFRVASHMRYDLEAADVRSGGAGQADADSADGSDQPEGEMHVEADTHTRGKFAGLSLSLRAEADQTITLYKYAAHVTSRDHAPETLADKAREFAEDAQERGFDALLAAQREAWAEKWRDGDIAIEGDAKAQQAIRFNIFQLHQTYTGEDDRLNIGPKGFTGEKYGGSTYWDTEAYCLPFYLSTADSSVARNLLIYRYKHLGKAKENAAKLGFSKGALYPMVTMNGEECHNEWEITFEEIHRNGAIAYAIYNYVEYTGDTSYLGEYGFEVLAELSRFWEERVNHSERKGYMILGVTGPNEYENNVSNNWYTNRMAAWTLEYTGQVAAELRKNEPEAYEALINRISLSEAELGKWADISKNMYLPQDDELGVFLQQDGFLDKEILPVSKLDAHNLPLNQKWSWDRILRSCYIKQADVLQGLFFLGDRYDLDTKKRNFDFYEPITVHESSLSPCVHAILAGELGYTDKAYEMYLRTSRLDLDNYNNDTEDGCHTTSMAGTWMSVVHGFGGLRVRGGRLVLNPFSPEEWTSLSFKVGFRGARLKVTVTGGSTVVENESESPASLTLYGREVEVPAGGSVSGEREA